MNRAPEFQFIHQYLKKLAGKGALELTDDAALLQGSSTEELVITTDAMVEGIHFFPNDPVDLIAKKLLRCNLSDLAGMGADPFGYFLTLSLPASCFTKKWFEAFTRGLSQDQELFNIALLGGDTTGNPDRMVFSITMLGKVTTGQALRRNSAQVGDGIWVTGTIGDAALGLLCLNKEIPENPYLINRYHLPQPRTGLNFNNIASAAMDISDGLVQDLGHIARESKVGAVIFASDIPLSAAARSLGKRYFETCVTGGDDFELLLTIPKENETLALQEAKRKNIALTKIGHCITDPNHDVKLYDESAHELIFKKTGWSHV